MISVRWKGRVQHLFVSIIGKFCYLRIWKKECRFWNAGTYQQGNRLWHNTIHRANALPFASSMPTVNSHKWAACHERVAFIGLKRAISNKFVRFTKVYWITFGKLKKTFTDTLLFFSFQKFPGYREEKKRCEYLHQKLSHIKGLITDYDRAQELS